MREFLHFCMRFLLLEKHTPFSGIKGKLKGKPPFCATKSPSNTCCSRGLRFVPKAGLEPARYRYQRILNPPRLPFHHSGPQAYYSMNQRVLQAGIGRKRKDCEALRFCVQDGCTLNNWCRPFQSRRHRNRQGPRIVRPIHCANNQISHRKQSEIHTVHVSAEKRCSPC